MHSFWVPIWKKAPFLRLLVPFVSGILLQWYIRFDWKQILLAAVCFAMLYLIGDGRDHLSYEDSFTPHASSISLTARDPALVGTNSASAVPAVTRVWRISILRAAIKRLRKLRVCCTSPASMKVYHNPPEASVL